MSNIIQVKVPQLPESVSEGSLIEWHVQEGQSVERDQNLIDLETDKVTLEIPAPQTGVLVRLLKQNGDTVNSEEAIAEIDTAATATKVEREAPTDASSKNSEVSSPPSSVAEKKVDTAAVATSSEKKGMVNDHPEKANEANSTSHAQALAMPAAQKMAAEQSVDLDQVEGSGRGGRVLKEDVQERAKNVSLADESQHATQTQSATVASEGERTEQRVAMTRLRQRIAERLSQSQKENVILTTFNEVNMKPVMDLRIKYKEKFEKEHGVKLGFMSFFVKAAVAALAKFPVVNASVDGKDIVYHGYFDIGIAVSSPRGLVVPILRNVAQLSLADIEKQITSFATKAKEGSLGLDELTGGTFSITNGGTFGSMMSTPIINPPQSAILGMHATRERPVVEDGQIAVRPMMYLALSYDHRIIDGREAVLFLVTIKEALEDPARLLLNI